jgi:ligand-binding sensor domain-containing protein/signal transduction histidine kinase
LHKNTEKVSPLKTVTALIFVLLICVPGAFPQTEPTIEENIFQSSKNLHQWGTISSFNGLPSERVNAIAQTDDGFLWFATDNGLAKFDGRRVQTNLSAGLSAVRVLSLAADSDGTLWIGTEKGGFYYRDNFFQPIQETAGFAINSIFVDGPTIYLTNPDGRVFRAVKRDGSVRTEMTLQSNLPIRNISKIGNELLIGTYNAGLLEIENGAAEQLITRPRPFFINVLARDSSDGLWFGTESRGEGSGLYFTEKLPDLKMIGDSLGTVNSIGFENNREIWVGTDERGAFYFKDLKFRQRFTFENTSGGLRSNKILAAFVDREGVIWFGTDKGINRYDPKSPRNEAVSDDVQSNFVRTLFLAGDGTLYAGTNRGLYGFSEGSENWRPIPGFERRTVYAVSETGGKRLLVGSSGSLTARGATTEQIVENESIRAIAQFQNTTFFSSFGNGLKKTGADALVFPQPNIISLYNQEEKLLWIGTINKGVFTYDGRKIAAPPELDELKTTAVTAIYGNQTDGIWFATDKGLYLFKDNELQIILANQNARDVFTQRGLEGKLRVWCATENGLFNLTFNENFGWISSRIDIEQGLSSQNIFKLLQLEDNSLLIGTNRGLVHYDTSETRPLLVPNRILSQRIHQPNELQTGINLNYPQNSLSVEVLAISSRTFPEQFQYSFLLYDSTGKLIDKKFSEDSQFLMENLEPDTYRVEIRAFDKNLLSSEPLSFNFTVEQAPFPLIPAILSVLLMIALAALIWAIVSQRKIFQTSKELVHANLELNDARLNLANEAERERHRISRDLHDQTLADLRHLILMADEVPGEQAGEFRSEIEGISDEIRRICEDLSPSVLENIGFAAALEWALGNSVEQVSKGMPIEYEFIAPENLEKNLNLSLSEQLQVYRIAQEVLSNIVRHSNATRIKMTAEISVEKGFVMKIRDNGKPFDPEKTRKGRGLANIAARAKLIEAEIGWKSRRQEGMIFTLSKA